MITQSDEASRGVRLEDPSAHTRAVRFATKYAGFVRFDIEQRRPGRGGVMTEYTYEVALGPAAQLFIATLASEEEKVELAAALRDELANSPNPSTQGRYGPNRVGCTHQIVVTGHTVVFSVMSEIELERFGREQGRPAAKSGFYVYDILSPGTAVT